MYRSISIVDVSITFCTPMANKHLVEVFRQALTELGYVEGQTIVLEARWAEGHPS
jgi:hypothetical protein